MACFIEMSRIFVSTANFTMFAVHKSSCGNRDLLKTGSLIYFPSTVLLSRLPIKFNVLYWDAATGDECWHLNMPFSNKFDMKSDPTANQFCVPTSEKKKQL